MFQEEGPVGQRNQTMRKYHVCCLQAVGAGSPTQPTLSHGRCTDSHVRLPKIHWCIKADVSSAYQQPFDREPTPVQATSERRFLVAALRCSRRSASCKTERQAPERRSSPLSAFITRAQNLHNISHIDPVKASVDQTRKFRWYRSKNTWPMREGCPSKGPITPVD